MEASNTYDVCIIGGGLAGLSLAILLAQQQKKVVLVEKNNYPQHKVCGEYISKESWRFLESLGVPLNSMQLPSIDNLQLTNYDNSELCSELPLGGFGISRYLLDNTLYKIALQKGVTMYVETSFLSYEMHENNYTIHTSKNTINAKLLVSAIGKHRQRSFSPDSITKNKYVGIKYHIKTDFPINKIALHAFEGGYAGVSAIENGNYCFCYLVQSAILKRYNGNIAEMEKEVLEKNTFLKNLIKNATQLWEKPIVISNVYFGKKQNKANTNILHIGDSMGAIPPLCGNGMSLAFRSAQILHTLIIEQLQGKIDHKQLLSKYHQQWNKHFATRIQFGILFQNLFFVPNLFSLALKSINRVPFLCKKLISLTHGKPF